MDLEYFCKNVGEQLLSPIITSGKLKTYYTIQITVLRFQVEYVAPKKLFLKNMMKTLLILIFML